MDVEQEAAVQQPVQQPLSQAELLNIIQQQSQLQQQQQQQMQFLLETVLNRQESTQMHLNTPKPILGPYDGTKLIT